MTIRIVMADAGTGDAFVVRTEGNDEPWVAIIDSGTPNTPTKSLLPCLKWLTNDLPKDEPYVNLLAVSHIDRDHIGGAVTILRSIQDGTLDLSIDAVWHNRFKMLTGAVDPVWWTPDSGMSPEEGGPCGSSCEVSAGVS